MAEDAEIGSGTSSRTKSAGKLLLNMAKDVKVDSNSDGGYNKMVERLLFKKLSGLTRYLTSLHSNADSALFEKK